MLVCSSFAMFPADAHIRGSLYPADLCDNRARSTLPNCAIAGALLPKRLASLAMLELVCLHRRAAWRPLFDRVDSPGSMMLPNLPGKGDQVGRMNRVPRNLVNFAEDQSARWFRSFNPAYPGLNFHPVTHATNLGTGAFRSIHSLYSRYAGSAPRCFSSVLARM